MNRFLLSLVVASALAAASCTKLTLAWADLKPDGPQAAPAALGVFDGQPGVTSVEQWEQSRAPALRAAFEREVYGRMPDGHRLTVLDRRVIDRQAFNGAGELSEFKLKAAVTFDGETEETAIFYMDVATPASDKSAPIILMQTFCPRWDTFPNTGVHRPKEAGGCGGGGLMSGVMTYVFGRYIASPPAEEILKRGYGIATIYPSEFAPDSNAEGLAALENMAGGMQDDDERWGAIAAWAWGFSLMVDALEADTDSPPRAYISWGHSRYGKSALLAAAYDDRIDGVIAHQSGTGGASLSRQKKGESVEAITGSYPHWFSKNYASFAGRENQMSVDQHQLLALIAPRPVLLGNARRDVWSDPNGAFRAAIGADPVYELYGSEGLAQARLDQWIPEADIAYWIRPGTHGVVKEDWPAFLSFLDAHFAPRRD